MPTSRPPRGSLVNLSNEETFDFLVNPHTIEESVEAHYKNQQVIGLSHSRKQFVSTGDAAIPIELFMSEELQRLYGSNFDQRQTMEEKKAWLKSLVYPVSNQDYSRVGATQVLLTVPNVIRIVGRVMRVSFMHREFHHEDMRTTTLVARIDIEEDLQVRRLMDEVAIEGSLHATDPRLRPAPEF